jgi:hypothetical protein
VVRYPSILVERLCALGAQLDSSWAIKNDDLQIFEPECEAALSLRPPFWC